MMKKIALFDFCKTLVSFQTADVFIDYVRMKDGNTYMKVLDVILRCLIKSRIIALLNIFFPGFAPSKKIKLLQLRGYKFEKLKNLAESFYRERIQPNLIMSVITEMQSLSKQDYEICLVSAGYSIYLNYFAKDYHIKHIISTEIGFDKNGIRCLGSISGKDCIHVEKVNMLKTYFAGQNVNYNDSISYSDSISDLPMLLLTGKGVVVSQSISQSWSHHYKFKEIIWSREIVEDLV